MNVFCDYASYYNLLYCDKDYVGETNFVLDVLKKHGCFPKTVLDLGCGTGRHAVEMAKRGISVTGVDMSETMLAMGKEMIAELNPRDFPALLPELLPGDVRTVHLCKQFDAVVSLFHVMSYQNTEDDVFTLMKTAKDHLNPGGFFLFDFWYGPGVLTDPPTIREKIFEDIDIFVNRKATPVHKINENIVDIQFDISIKNKNTDDEVSINECHSMRYWFLPELLYLSRQSNFSYITRGAWMSESDLDNNTWYGWLLLK